MDFGSLRVRPAPARHEIDTTVVVCCAVLAFSSIASAQDSKPIPVADSAEHVNSVDPAAGSHDEALLIDRCARNSVPIAVRPFGPRALEAMLSACGVSSEQTSSSALRLDRPKLEIRRLWLSSRINSRRALHEAGPVWAGRGVTASGSAGVRGRWWKITYALQPIAFWTQNLDFAPSKSLTVTEGDYSNPWFIGIDAPYRFGDDPYGRVDLGDSYVRVDAPWIGMGVSTSAQWWGPARIYPLVLGNTAGGFPHVFLETARPLNAGVGVFVLRWAGGRLIASGVGPNGNTGRARLGIGAVGSFVPKILPALEVGASRFFHVYDSPATRDFTSALLPFSGLFKSRLGAIEAGDRSYNQLASAFFRLAPPSASLEVYGEYFREDHSADLRDFIVEMDHQSAYMVGLRRSQVSRGSSTALTIEASNGRLTHLARVREQGAAYRHNEIIEGHTSRGLPLANPALPGGGALTVAWERATMSNEWSVTVEIRRVAQNEEGGNWQGRPTGYYWIRLSRGIRRRAALWETGINIQPGFGDVPGMNVGAHVRLTR